MFICLDCGEIFEKPKIFTETHGLGSTPYEELYGCPLCGGSYAETYRCDVCGKYVEDEYITTDKGDIICDNCYTTHSVYD